MKMKVLLGISCGFALGGILAVLFAPTDGKTTRDKIVKAKDDLQDEINDGLGQVLKMVSDKCNSLVNAGSDLAEEAKDMYERQHTDEY